MTQILQFSNPKGLLQPLAFSQLIQVTGGSLLALSGQVALDENGQIVGQGDLAAQTTQAFNNIGLLLKAASSNFSQLIKLTIYVSNYQVDYLPIILNAQNQFIDAERRPASTLIGVESLANPKLLIEIEALAAVG